MTLLVQIIEGFTLEETLISKGRSLMYNSQTSNELVFILLRSYARM
jgi:hypothetical protein